MVLEVAERLPEPAVIPGHRAGSVKMPSCAGAGEAFEDAVNGTLKDVPRVSLPFQIIETVNESRATREAKKRGQQMTLFDVYEGNEGDTFEDGWKTKPFSWRRNLPPLTCRPAPAPHTADYHTLWLG